MTVMTASDRRKPAGLKGGFQNMTVHVFSEKIHEIVPENSLVEKLATGFEFTEGPVWDPGLKALYFTDFPVLKIYLWDAEKGARLYTGDSGRAIGLTLDREGRLLSCESKKRRITRTEKDGRVIDIGSTYKGARINSPNDLVAKSDGSVYFTDPYSTLLMDTRELDFDGVLRIDGNEITLQTDEFKRPNGLAFSPDESLLYINDTTLRIIKVFDVGPGGSLSKGRLFAEIGTEFGPGVPDGMKVDTAGNVYVTGSGGIWVLSPEGEKLGIIKTPETAANMCFGEEDGKTMYITATRSLYRIRLSIPGIMAGRPL